MEVIIIEKKTFEKIVSDALALEKQVCTLSNKSAQLELQLSLGF